jgi:palmitoyl transferase
VSFNRFRRLLVLIAALNCASALAVDCGADPASADLSFIDRACSRLTDTWKKGKNELLLSGYSWHTPWTWTEGAARRGKPMGMGWRLRQDRRGSQRRHALGVRLAFLDSHKNIQWQVGYGWSTFWGSRDGIQPGLGYAALIVQRPDIANGIPFPAVLPIVTLRYGGARIDATYIPNFGGGINHGSVFYVLGRVILD